MDQTAAASLLVLLTVTMVSAQRFWMAEQCFNDKLYVCRGTYHVQRCSDEAIENCAVVGRGFVCIPGGEYIEDACQPISPCSSSGPRAMLGAGKEFPRLCSIYTICEDRGNQSFEIFVHQCEAGYEYSTKQKKCVPISVANCSKKNSGCVPGTIIPSKKYCNEYKYCTTIGIFSLQVCPKFRPYFSIETLSCTHTNTNNEVCGNRIINSYTKTTPLLPTTTPISTPPFPDTTRICSTFPPNTTPIPTESPPNTIPTCTPPSPNTTPISTPPTTDTIPICKTSTPNTTPISTPLPPYTDPIFTTSLLNDSPCIPYSRSEVMEDCRKFKECSAVGVSVTKICPFDYFYDISNTQCVNEESAKCGGRPHGPRKFNRERKILSFKELLH